ncbi:hypothetical protein Mal15_28340 [Stieleria maiorica]|uniref:Uncharacterized protein n=1 Tax=Stieleria maiorica TaxID=2795974 RepID=A0A5B9MCM5_9BACT|nr:MFS transporter [Stieleria maiorica]QEF98778.1 hypothetical protein Mal15_28340 [Stieleria maiorica]
MPTAAQESSIQQRLLNRFEIASQPDDRRRAKRWPMLRILAVLRDTAAIAFFGLLFFSESFDILENLTGLSVTWVTKPLVSYIFCAGFALALLSPLLTRILSTRFREKRFEAVPETPWFLFLYREKAEKILDEFGFIRIGTFRVDGETSPTFIEVYLSSRQRVVAVFHLRMGTKWTELVSMTDSGRVIVTSSQADSEADNEADNATESTPSIVMTTVPERPFDDMVAFHRQKSIETTEATDSPITELAETDVVDVLRYCNRAKHDLQVNRGLSRDKVGPMSYGRFRFPVGVIA